MRGMCFLCRDAFRRFHIFTVPLSPTRASFLLGGRNKHMGYEAYQVLTQSLHPAFPVQEDALSGSVNSCVAADLPYMQASFRQSHLPTPL